MVVTDSIAEWKPSAVQSAGLEIEQEIQNKEQRRFQRIFATHCTEVLRKAKRQNRNQASNVSKRPCLNQISVSMKDNTLNHPSLSSTHGTNPSQKLYTVTHRRRGKFPQSVLSIPLTQLKSSGKRTHLPTYEFCVPVSHSFQVPDEPELAFVPLIEKRGDEPLSRHTVLSMHQTSYRERLIEYGAECEQEQVQQKMDALFRRLFTIHDHIMGDVRIPPPDHKVWARIANCTREPRSRVMDCFAEWLTTHVSVVGSEEEMPVEEIEKASENSNETQNALDVQYEQAADSYRKVWCRQCYIYDCNLHGLANKPSVGVQTMLAKWKEMDGFWQPVPQKVDLNFKKRTYMTNRPLDGVRLSVCKQLHTIFDGDLDRIAFILGVPVPIVEEYLSRQRQAGLLNDVEQHVLDSMGRLKKKQVGKFYSVKNYKPEWYKRYRDSKIFPFFFPCLHDNPCSDSKNCTCIQNRFFCTPACGWNRRSPNFFRGCDCIAKCTTTCTCFLAKRECDPDLCKCTVAKDPPNQLITTQRCRNDNMTMSRSPPLLIGVSDVSGWGVFTRRPLNAGDYVGKYVGEVMSQEEAERRGLIADEKEVSYLFLMASDVSIDACRKGSKVRFVNHSSTPNVKPQSTYFHFGYKF